MSFATAVDLLQRGAVVAFGEDSEPVLYHPGGAGSFAVEGIFRDAGLAVDPNLSAQVQMESPELHVQESAVLAATGASELIAGEPADGPDEVTVRGERYTVGQLEHDGEGMALLFLKKGLE